MQAPCSARCGTPRASVRTRGVRPAWRGRCLTACGLAALFLGMTTAAALDIGYDIQPRVLRIGEAATCTFRVQGLQQAPPPQLPTVEGLQISGPSHQTSFMNQNGRVTHSVTYQYRLTPTKTGTFTFGPFQYRVQGQTLDVPALQLQVVAPGEGRFSGEGEPQLRDMLFARLQVERETVYHQEFFDLYLSIYHRGIRLGRQVRTLNHPEGLSFQNLEELRSSREVVNGRIFEVLRLRSRMQALTAGEFTLNPTVEVQLVIQGQRNTGRGFFDSFFQREQVQPVQLSPEPIKLTVKSLPEAGKPENFSGAVGQFQFDVQVAPVDLTAGDPITIRATIAGQGNITAVTAPMIVLGDDYKVYEPKLAEQKIGPGRNEGMKAFEQVVIPRSDAGNELPAFHFSYFDPKGERYITLTRGPFPLRIAAAPEGGSRLLEANGILSRTQREVLGRDIVYIKPAPRAWQRTGQSPWYATPAFLAAQALPPLLLGLVFLVARRRDALAGDVARARRLQAPRSARAGLLKAERSLRTADPVAFYEGLWEALASYFGNRLNLAPGDVTMDHVLDVMRNGGLAEEDADRLRGIYRVCEASRFGGSPTEGAGRDETARPQMRSHLDEFNRVLKACEKVRV